MKESNALAERVAKAHRDMEEQIAANTALLAQTSHKRLELVAKQEEITRLQARPFLLTLKPLLRDWLLSVVNAYLIECAALSLTDLPCL